MQQNNDHNVWKSQAGFIWAMIGSAVGFANILSFSAKCYYNGGGAFILPLLVAFFILGIPLLVLEGVIGQKFQLPLVSAYGQVVGSWGKFLGWLSILSVTTIGSYYIVLTGWTIAYSYYSALSKIGPDTGSFFFNSFLRDSGGLTTLGSFAPAMFLFTIFACLFTWFVMVRDIQDGVEKVCSIFMPLLSVLILGFALFVCFLPGAATGFRYFLIPDFAKLTDPKIWLASFGQIFFSLSLALGIVVGYSRHTGEDINIPRSMLWVAMGDLLISLLAGFAIFGCIGFMSHAQGIPFTSVVTPSMFGLGFVVFPKILQQFHPFISMFFGPLFFFSLFIAGITGVFSIVESIAGNFEVEFDMSRAKAITVTIGLMFAFSSVFSFGNATHIIDALEPMTAGFNMLIGGLAEIMVFLYLSATIMNHKAWFCGDTKRTFSYYSLKFFVPFVLVVIFGAAVNAEIQSGFGAPEMVRWGWLAGAVALAAYLSRNGKQNSVIRQ